MSTDGAALARIGAEALRDAVLDPRIETGNPALRVLLDRANEIDAGYSKGGTATPDPAGVSEAPEDPWRWVQSEFGAKIHAYRSDRSREYQRSLCGCEAERLSGQLSMPTAMLRHELACKRCLRSALPHLSGPAVTDTVEES